MRFQFHLVRLKAFINGKYKEFDLVSIPFSTIKSSVFHFRFVLFLVSIPFSTIKSAREGEVVFL